MINQIISQRYEILEKTGDGPLFVTFKARDTAMDRIVAVKMLKQPFLSDAVLPTSMRAALEETVVLNHPGIARFYEYRDEADIIYSVSEYIRGIDLKERIRRIAPFTLALAIDFACAIADALQHAHSLGKVHGDLRPQNIIVSPEGVLKVSGFGVQKGATSSLAAQEALLQLSSPYHAPELSTTQPGSQAGDIYALGAIVYEMLTGSTPYHGHSADDQSEGHAFAEIPSARVLNPGVPRAVDGIISRCLMKRPEERYRSVIELLNDLKSVRDALRFGKPLTGLISEPLPEPAPAPVTQRLVPAQEPVEPVQPVRTYERNKLRRQDEKVSSYLRAAITSVGIFILIIGVVIYGIYLVNWVVPPTATVPEFVGKSIEEVRKIAASNKFRLMEHAEYNEKARGVVYQSDQTAGAQLRTQHVINVWYSRGPEYVNVPNVVNLPRDQAEQQLKDAGLKVGRVTPEYSDKVPENVVIAQDVSFKKRVFHDTAVSLTVSNGPDPANPGSGPDTPANTAGQDTGSGDTPPAPGAEGGTADSTDTTERETHTFTRTININHDGRGRRQVRVKYKDALGEHPAVIDEGHDEGDKILIKFDYAGKAITLTIEYDGQVVFDKTFDPQAVRKRTLQ